MFKGFMDFFKKPVQYDIYGNDYRTFIIAFGGMQFGKGLFTVFDKPSALEWERRLGKSFPEYKGKFRLFGYDWMGRCFAVPAMDEEKIIVFDPGVFEVYEVPLNFTYFVNKAIPMNTNDCLSSDAFISWYRSGGKLPDEGKCIAYVVPLFLGGQDALENFELADMQEYWQMISVAGMKLHGISEEESEERKPAEDEEGLVVEEAEENEIEENEAESIEQEQADGDGVEADSTDDEADVADETDIIDEMDFESLGEDEAAEDTADDEIDEDAAESVDVEAVDEEISGEEIPEAESDAFGEENFDLFDEAQEYDQSEDEFFARQADEAEEFFLKQKKRAEYIDKNVDTYLEKFKKMHSNSSGVSWNWCGFLFNLAWLIYRKMYKAFILMFIVGLVLGAAVGVGFVMAGIDVYVDRNLYLGVCCALSLVLMLICGMFGNLWYRRRLDKLVADGEAAETDEERERIYKKGGVNIPLMIVVAVISLLSSASSLIMFMFPL